MMSDAIRPEGRMTVNLSHSGRRWRKGSKFGPAPKCPLTAAQRREWRTGVEAAREEKGGLTIGGKAVAQALSTYVSADGSCYPSQAAIAERAQVSVSTVKRALPVLIAAGLIEVTARVVRSGWRVVQTSNAYVLRTGAQIAPEAVKERIKKAFQGVTKPRAARPPAAPQRVLTEMAQVVRKISASSEQRPSNLTDDEAFANRDRQLRLLNPD